MSQEKGVVSKDFSEEKELEQMLQGRVKVRQGEKRGRQQKCDSCKSLGSGARTQPAWGAPKSAAKMNPQRQDMPHIQ